MFKNEILNFKNIDKVMINREELIKDQRISKIINANYNS